MGLSLLVHVYRLVMLEPLASLLELKLLACMPFHFKLEIIYHNIYYSVLSGFTVLWSTRVSTVPFSRLKILFFSPAAPHFFSLTLFFFPCHSPLCYSFSALLFLLPPLLTPPLSLPLALLQSPPTLSPVAFVLARAYSSVCPSPSLSLSFQCVQLL